MFIVGQVPFGRQGNIAVLYKGRLALLFFLLSDGLGKLRGGSLAMLFFVQIVDQVSFLLVELDLDDLKGQSAYCIISLKIKYP